MEQRKYPRVQIPLLVELQHPSLGKTRCVALDVSEGGIFVLLENAPVKPGAKLKLTLLNTLPTDNQPTPTVDAEVKRVEANGLGLEFSTSSSRHLWRSVERLRVELAVGRDYFQVYTNAVVLNQLHQILVVQQHGKWTLPGHFLMVGEDWRTALARYLGETFALKDITIDEVMDVQNLAPDEVPEAALMRLYALVHANSEGFAFEKSERYRSARWVERRRGLEELTFVSDYLRELAVAALGRDPRVDSP